MADVDGDALCDEPDTLQEILLYHVTPDVLPSIQMEEGTSYLRTLQGGSIALTYSISDMDSETINVNDAMVVSKDVGTRNGLIHIIDQVLAIPDPTSDSGMPETGNHPPMTMGSGKNMGRRRRRN